MPLEAPKLDDRTFQNLVDEAKRQIPRHTPEWTDHNVSDPGVTLIELFAYMVDLLLYRINRVPERNYIKWLDLLGIQLRPPRPATVDLTFELTAPQPAEVHIPVGTEVATVRTESQEAIIFSTVQDLAIYPPTRIACLVQRPRPGDEGGRGSRYYDYERVFDNPDEKLTIFQEVPQVDDAIYFGYQEDLGGHMLKLDLTIPVEGEGVGVNPTNPPFRWECWVGESGGSRWQPVEILSDATSGFNKSGVVVMQVPFAAQRRVVYRREAFWLRARVVPPKGDQRPYTSSPRITKVSTAAIGGAVAAQQFEQIVGEVLGRSDGTAGQEWTLQLHPVLLREPGETLEVVAEDGTFEQWIEVPQFSGEEEEDKPYFTLDSVSGVIRFGPAIRKSDGSLMQLGRIPPANHLLRFTRYRHGGGEQGNMPRETITVLKSAIPYVKDVKNRKGASGGEDAESLELAKLRAPQELRQRTRAVTREDFEELTKKAAPGEIARCRCIDPTPPKGHEETIAEPDLDRTDGPPAGANGDQDGATEAPEGRKRVRLVLPRVKVLVVPMIAQSDQHLDRQALKELDPRLSRKIMAYLNERRLLTAQVEVKAPHYTWVAVEVVAQPRRRQAAARAAVEKAIERRLYQYINPVYGGPRGDGRDFGEPLYLSEVTAIVQGVDGVEYVEAVRLFTVGEDGLRTPVTDRVLPAPGGLLASDTHTVTIL